MEEINLKELLGYIKRYYYVIIMLVLFTLCVTCIYEIAIKTPKYTTYTTLVLVKENTKELESINQNDVTLNKNLVTTYSEIVKSRLVLDQVLDKLKLDYNLDELAKEIDVKEIDDTEILKISVTDDDPNLATDIANTTANIFKDEVTKIYNLNNVSIIDEAKVPEEVSNNTLIRDLVLAFAGSFILSLGIITVIYYFDDTLYEGESLESDVELPIIGRIYKDNSRNQLLVAHMPKALTSESIRTLRANMQFSNVDGNVKTLLLTSTMPGEGKSFISSNLAISFAQAGKKVLIIDCDLRKGRQHQIFNVASKNGLSNLLVEDINNYQNYIYRTPIVNVDLIPRGAFPPNPSELLSSKKMKLLLDKLKEMYDIIVLDGAPCGGLSDSLVLSNIVDRTLLVCTVDYTSKKGLKHAISELHKINANVAGCVVNNMHIRKDTYGYYSYNYGGGK